MFAAIVLATLLLELFAGFGCVSFTIVIMSFAGILIAARIGAAPRVARFLKLLAEGTEDIDLVVAPDENPKKEVKGHVRKHPSDLD